MSLGFFSRVLVPHDLCSSGFSCHKVPTGSRCQPSPGPRIWEFHVQRTSTHVWITFMLTAILITVSRMQNAFRQSFHLIVAVTRSLDLNEVRSGIMLTPTHLSATYQLILALPCESMVEICGIIPRPLPACGWVWLGGEGRVCGLSPNNEPSHFRK